MKIKIEQAVEKLEEELVSPQYSWAEHLVLIICRRTTRKAAARHHQRKSPRRKRLLRRARQLCVRPLRLVTTGEIGSWYCSWTWHRYKEDGMIP
jgi:hypothetical protein